LLLKETEEWNDQVTTASSSFAKTLRERKQIRPLPRVGKAKRINNGEGGGNRVKTNGLGVTRFFCKLISMIITTQRGWEIGTRGGNGV